MGHPDHALLLRRGDLRCTRRPSTSAARPFCSPPGYFGKTTLAAGFDAAGYRVLSEDVSCIRLTSAPAVVPGPAMLRVRHDVAGQLVLPRARAVAESGDRVHYSLDPDRRGDSAPVPLRAVVLLRSVEEGIVLEPVPATDALRDLWPLSFRLPTAEDRARCFEGIAQLAASVRLWNLARPLRIDALESVVERIVADA